jgi:hypothetical protein
MNIDTNGLGSKISGTIDWILFLPWLLLMIPFVAVPSVIAALLGSDGYSTAVYMMRLFMFLVMLAIFIGATFFTVVWPWLGGFSRAVLLGTWLTPLGMLLFIGLTGGIGAFFNVEWMTRLDHMIGLPTEHFMIGGTAICATTKIIHSIVKR